MTFLLLVLLVFFKAGLVRLVLQRKHEIQRYRFGNEFLENLHIFMESHGSNMEVYAWLTHRSHKMQGAMEDLGICQSFHDPLSNHVYTNYPLILNLLPKLRKSSEKTGLSGASPLFTEYGNIMQEVLIRYDGQLADIIEQISKSIKNPFNVLREGIQFSLFLPAHIWGWFGVSGSSAASRFATGAIAAFLSAIVSLLGLVSAIITVVMDAQNTLDILKDWIF